MRTALLVWWLIANGQIISQHETYTDCVRVGYTLPMAVKWSCEL